MPRVFKRLTVLMGILTLCACAEQQAPEAPEVAAACLQCHHNEGDAAIPGWPPLTVLSEEEIRGKLRAYRDRANPDSRMTDIAHKLGDDEIEQLARFYGRD